MPSATIEVPAGPQAPQMARSFAEGCLHRWKLDHLVDRVLLAASELVTNAVKHGEAPVTVRLSLRSLCVRLEVRDANQEVPTLRSPDQEGGFGLHLVRQVCTSWGVSSTDGGKVVWCECPAEPSR